MNDSPQDKDRPWFRLMRRAFRVPDLVNHEHAVEAIALALLPEPDGNAIPPWTEQLNGAREVVKTLEDFADTGKLDRYLVRLSPSFRPWDEGGRESLLSDLGHSVQLRPDPYVRPAIERLLDATMLHALDHPFYEEDGPPPAEVEPWARFE
jgi:hypothetical protein